MIDLYKRYPHIYCIVTPESFCNYPINLAWIDKIWTDNILHNQLSLCCGGYRLAEERLYNSLFVFSKNNKTYFYDKQHLFYITESIPPFWPYIPGMSTLFLHEKKPFVGGKRNREPCNIPLIGSFVPYICSELLFSHHPLDEYVDLPIICLANDSWFNESYMPRLMLFQAQMKALEWKRPILYIAYCHAVWIDTLGNITDLQV